MYSRFRFQVPAYKNSHFRARKNISGFLVRRWSIFPQPIHADVQLHRQAGIRRQLRTNRMELVYQAQKIPEIKLPKLWSRILQVMHIRSRWEVSSPKYLECAGFVNVLDSKIPLDHHRWGSGRQGSTRACKVFHDRKKANFKVWWDPDADMAFGNAPVLFIIFIMPYHVFLIWVPHSKLALSETR